MSFLSRFEQTKILADWRDHLKKEDKDVPIVELQAQDKKEYKSKVEPSVDLESKKQARREKKDSEKKWKQEKQQQTAPKEETPKKEEPKKEGSFPVADEKEIPGIKSIERIKKMSPYIFVASSIGKETERPAFIKDLEDLAKGDSIQKLLDAESEAHNIVKGVDAFFVAKDLVPKIEELIKKHTELKYFLEPFDMDKDKERISFDNYDFKSLGEDVAADSLVDALNAELVTLEEEGEKQEVKKESPKKAAPTKEVDDEGEAHTRLDEIKAMNPYLFIVNGLKKDSERSLLMDKLKQFSQPENMERLLDASKPKNAALKGVDAFFVSKPVSNEIQQLIDANPNLKFYFQPFDISKFGTERAFDEYDYSSLGEQINPQPLKDALTKVLIPLEKEEAKTEHDPSDIPALQISSVGIPLNILRFMSKTPKKYEFYIGGQPKSAGMEGYIYVLCDKREADVFRKVMTAFKHPKLFYQNLNYLPDIDQNFKALDPYKYQPVGALILEAKTKFDPDQLHDPKTYEEIKDEAKWKKEHEGEEPVTQLDILHGIVSEKLMNKSKAGAFKVFKYIIGDWIINMSTDYKKCILYSGKPTIQIDKKELLELLPFVDSVEDSYI